MIKVGDTGATGATGAIGEKGATGASVMTYLFSSDQTNGAGTNKYIGQGNTGKFNEVCYPVLFDCTVTEAVVSIRSNSMSKFSGSINLSINETNEEIITYNENSQNCQHKNLNFDLKKCDLIAISVNPNPTTNNVSIHISVILKVKAK